MTRYCLSLCALTWLAGCYTVDDAPQDVPLAAQEQQQSGGESGNAGNVPNGQQQSGTAQPPPGQAVGTPLPPPPPGASAAIDVACQFADGWASVMPASAFDPNEEFVMQALIGFSTEPAFWSGLPEYAHLRPYAAQRCSGSASHFAVAPGNYVVLVGWAGRFDVLGEYRDNGYLEQVSVTAGQTISRTLTPAQMTRTWVCISCPYLLVWRDGGWTTAGTVLVDRYARGEAGTDVRHVRTSVRGGRVRIRIEEREPEITHLDAIEVRLADRVLAPLGDEALRRADGTERTLRTGDAVDATFDARGVADGAIDVEVRVTGWYEIAGPRL